MIYIDTNNPTIILAKETHYKFLRYILKKKLNGKFFKEEEPLAGMNQVNKVYGIDACISRYLNNEENLRKVLIGRPEELDEIKQKFTRVKQIKSIKKLLNYDSFINFREKSTYKKYNAYSLAENLDIPTCVYCNRMYTKTVISETGGRITRPTFDHWFPKGQFPLLSLSFYNLIPSCTICNSGVKGAIPFNLSTHFHPYYVNSDETFGYTFSFKHTDYDKFQFKIVTDDSSDFSKKSVEAFKLEEIYRTHEDEIIDLRKIKDVYTENYLKILESQILGVPLDRKEVYRLAFGVHYQEAKFDRRPLSKMKKDILIELGIIK